MGKPCFPFKAESANACPYPAVHSSEQLGDLSYAEILGPSSEHCIELSDDGFDISSLLPSGHVADSLFELLHGFVSDSHTIVSKPEPEKLETLPEIREACLGLVEGEFEFSEYLLGIGQS